MERQTLKYIVHIDRKDLICWSYTWTISVKQTGCVTSSVIDSIQESNLLVYLDVNLKVYLEISWKLALWHKVKLGGKVLTRTIGWFNYHILSSVHESILGVILGNILGCGYRWIHRVYFGVYSQHDGSVLPTAVKSRLKRRLRKIYKNIVEYVFGSIMSIVFWCIDELGRILRVYLGMYIK